MQRGGKNGVAQLMGIAQRNGQVGGWPRDLVYQYKAEKRGLMHMTGLNYHLYSICSVPGSCSLPLLLLLLLVTCPNEVQVAYYGP